MVADVPTWAWRLTVVGLLGVVAVDLVVIGRRRRQVTLRDATVWVLVYVGLAEAFAGGLASFAGPTAAGEFVAGYLTEYSLSVDNLFVFMITIARFGVAALAQDKVLYIGIVVSMVLRARCIAAGAAALSAFNWVFYAFGAVLVYTAVKLLLAGENDDDDFQEGRVLRLVRRVLPSTPAYDGTRLVVRQDGAPAGHPPGPRHRRHQHRQCRLRAGLDPCDLRADDGHLHRLHGERLRPDGAASALLSSWAGCSTGSSTSTSGSPSCSPFIGAKLVVEALEGSHVDHVGALVLPHIGIVFSLCFIAATLAVTSVASLVRGRSGPTVA